MDDVTRQETKDALKALIDNAINDAKNEITDRKDHFRESRDAIESLKNIVESKRTGMPVLNIIQTIVAVLVVVLSLGGSWYNSKIETNSFFNSLNYLKEEVIELKEKVKSNEHLHYSQGSEIKLIDQRLDIFIKDFESHKKNK